MRDPARIPEILARIQKVWEQHPDQRLGQLIENALREDDGDLFYVEDEILASRVAELDGWLRALRAAVPWTIPKKVEKP